MSDGSGTFWLCSFGFAVSEFVHAELCEAALTLQPSRKNRCSHKRSKNQAVNNTAERFLSLLAKQRLRQLKVASPRCRPSYVAAAGCGGLDSARRYGHRVGTCDVASLHPSSKRRKHSLARDEEICDQSSCPLEKKTPLFIPATIYYFKYECSPS